MTHRPTGAPAPTYTAQAEEACAAHEVDTLPELFLELLSVARAAGLSVNPFIDGWAACTDEARFLVELQAELDTHLQQLAGDRVGLAA
jgi:hypothetical protein